MFLKLVHESGKVCYGGIALFVFVYERNGVKHKYLCINYSYLCINTTRPDSFPSSEKRFYWHRVSATIKWKKRHRGDNWRSNTLFCIRIHNSQKKTRPIVFWNLATKSFMFIFLVISFDIRKEKQKWNHFNSMMTLCWISEHEHHKHDWSALILIGLFFSFYLQEQFNSEPSIIVINWLDCTENTTKNCRNKSRVVISNNITSNKIMSELCQNNKLFTYW